MHTNTSKVGDSANGNLNRIVGQQISYRGEMLLLEINPDGSGGYIEGIGKVMPGHIQEIQTNDSDRIEKAINHCKFNRVLEEVIYSVRLDLPEYVQKRIDSLSIHRFAEFIDGINLDQVLNEDRIQNGLREILDEIEGYVSDEVEDEIDSEMENEEDESVA